MDTLICNEVKIHKISTKKPIPDWLPDSKKKELIKCDDEVGKRITLIQDFEMPVSSHNIKVTDDRNLVFVTGTYKPRVRCFSMFEKSMKYERCMDAEAIGIEFLVDDGTKYVVMREDRYLEVHNQGGNFYMFRLPKFGRDMCYNKTDCDLYCVGSGNEVYRFNFQQGRYLNPYATNAYGLVCCTLNPIHQLFVCGTEEGQIEAFDPRCKERVGILDCACDTAEEISDLDSLPAVTSVSFRDGLTMAVGMSTGQILVYDIRANKPKIVKDHNNGFPIKKLAFHPSDTIVSMDQQMIKLWNHKDGKMFTYINESQVMHDFCLVPDSGMLFVVGEYRSVNSYFIPDLGTAPKWCSFLDSLSLESEESNSTNVYDDYKFITREELENLNLMALIGTNLLKGYMHGYFIDSRLYHKAKKTSLAE